MAKSLKEAGVKELDAFKRRVRRQLALERISKPDHDALIEHVDEMEAIISRMEEKGEDWW